MSRATISVRLMDKTTPIVSNDHNQKHVDL